MMRKSCHTYKLMKTVCGFYTLSLKQMDGQKPFSEPRRARTRTETTSVPLYSV